MSDISSTLAAAATSAAAAAATTSADSAPECDGGNGYDGIMGLRISSIFVILIGATIGAVFPTWIRRRGGRANYLLPDKAFFVAKYFGSGVIIATAFIHLLAPANEALTDECLANEPITAYPWVEGIALMTIFSLFFVELMAMRYARFTPHDMDGEFDNEHSHANRLNDGSKGPAETLNATSSKEEGGAKADRSPGSRKGSHVPGEDHLGHIRTHVDNDPSPMTGAAERSRTLSTTANPEDFEAAINDALIDKQKQRRIEDYAAQLTSIFILEFGVIFHSIFIGLTLAVTGSDEFATLYVVLVFHQTFEGLGLGSRLAVTPWPPNKRWTPYLLGFGYALSTPIAIAIGLGVRETYEPSSRTALMVNGVFDSISAGILIYTGLVELMAHEFMFSETMRHAKIGTVLSGVGLMVLGAGLMALLGEWA